MLLFPGAILVVSAGDSVFNPNMHILKEPLFHFILIGAVFFGIYSELNRSSHSDDVIITEEALLALKSEFKKDWNRSATDEELDILIEDLIREELAVREGLELGLDEHDPVIRQRLRQKLELMVEESAVVGEPTEEELEEYLKVNWDLFRNFDGSVPPLNEIRNLVIFEWENTQRMHQLEQYYKDLETKYGLQVETR